MPQKEYAMQSRSGSDRHGAGLRKRKRGGRRHTPEWNRPPRAVHYHESEHYGNARRHRAAVARQKSCRPRDGLHRPCTHPLARARTYQGDLADIGGIRGQGENPQYRREQLQPAPSRRVAGVCTHTSRRQSNRDRAVHDPARCRGLYVPQGHSGGSMGTVGTGRYRRAR